MCWASRVLRNAWLSGKALSLFDLGSCNLSVRLIFSGCKDKLGGGWGKA